MPYESAIGSDPFAEQDGANRRVILLIAAILLVALCALGVFVLAAGNI
jgi:hypothetical protein